MHSGGGRSVDDGGQSAQDVFGEEASKVARMAMSLPPPPTGSPAVDEAIASFDAAMREQLRNLARATYEVGLKMEDP